LLIVQYFESFSSQTHLNLEGVNHNCPLLLIYPSVKQPQHETCYLT